MKIRNSKLKIGEKGFTLVELLTIVGILIILTALAIPAFRYFQRESDLNNSAEEIINTLRLAQNKTLSSEDASQWGVYFSTSTDPYQYILFKGANFASRATSSDGVHRLPTSVESYEINLASGESEVVFDRVAGTTSQSGKISLRLKIDHSKIRSIFIQDSGQITLGEQPLPTDTHRIKDSRHVHFDYSRTIATSTEKIILTFIYNTSTTSKEIIIADNLKDHQIYWEGEVDAGGEAQKIKIHTHILDDSFSGTKFCIHRDRKYNTKALKIEISGDPSGNLIFYDASGQTTKGTSIYVSELEWQ